MIAARARFKVLCTLLPLFESFAGNAKRTVSSAYDPSGEEDTT